MLRIAREQIEARGELGTPRTIAILALSCAAGIFIARGFLAPEVRDKADVAAAVALGMSLLFASGARSVHRENVRSRAQVREIRRLTLVALEALVAKPEFVVKSLEREHLATLEGLRKVDPVVYARVRDALLG